MSVWPSMSLTKRIDLPSGANAGELSSSGLKVTWRGSQSTVSMTQTLPPAIMASSSPSEEKLTSLADSNVRRTTGSGSTSLSQ